jgi:hypothetical protein
LRISVFADDGGAISPRPGRWEIVGGDGAEHSEHVSSFNNSQRSNSRSLRLPHLVEPARRAHAKLDRVLL